MKSNRVKQSLKSGMPVVGTMVSEMRNPEIANILAAAGMNFFVLDLEHSSVGTESAQHIIRAGRAAGLVPIVRVSVNLYPFIARVLDLGAMGIMVPHVDTPEQARYAVSCAKFPPLGERGYGLRGVVTDFEGLGPGEVASWVNEHTMIIIQVESGESVAKLEETLKVPGIDVALIGPNDLSLSLGVPGDFQHPRFVEAVERTFRVCLNAGVSPALHTRDLKAAKRYRDMGMRFMLYSSDSRMLLAAAREAAKQLMDGVREAT